MKLLDLLPSIFSEAQRRELEKLLNSEIQDKKIVWQDVLTKTFSERLTDLRQPYVISRIIGYSKILPVKIVHKLEDIIVTLLALISENNLIASLIGKHEMFRKDVVKAYTDASTQFLKMADNTIKSYKINMIEVKDGAISLAPNMRKQYFPININSNIFPENVIAVSGNQPSPENTFPGTESGYWITSILSKSKCDAGAMLEFDFGGVISFNNIIIQSAGKYVVNINKLEIPKADESGVWVVVNPDDYRVDISEKKIVLHVKTDPLRTKKIKLTLIQPKYDFIWEKTIDNTETYLEGIVNNDDASLLEEKNKIVNDVLLKDQSVELVKTRKYSNVYEYIIGCYNVSFLLETYSGTEPGIFTSRKYTMDDPIKTVKIVSEEYKPTYSTIEYEIVQSDDSIIAVPAANSAVLLTQLFDKSEVFSNMTGNVITLSSYPVIEVLSNIDIRVNGVSYDVVDEFTQDNQCIIRKNKIFFNKNLKGSIINVTYKHYSDYIIIRIKMKTNTDNTASAAPMILSFDVKLNEE